MKKILGLTIMLSALIFVFASNNANAKSTNEVYKNLTYTVNTNDDSNEYLAEFTRGKQEYITITGTTNENYKSVSIPETINDIPVRVIGRDAFYNNPKLESATMSDNIIIVDTAAFACSNNIKSVTLSKNLRVIDENAFFGCEKLSKITLPEGLKKIGKGGFSESALTEIELPIGITKINEDTFSGCEKLTKANLSKNTTYIGKYAFSGCGKLGNIELPKSVKKIDTMAFAGCQSLTKFKMPEALTEVNKGVFYCCDNLQKVIFNKNLEKIDDTAFEECLCIKIRIPDNIKKIMFNGRKIENTKEITKAGKYMLYTTNKVKLRFTLDK